MKKVIIGIIILAICAVVLIKLLSKPSLFELASKAELQGDYSAALENYIKALSNVAEAIAYPDKSKAATVTEKDWIKEVEKYISWTAYSLPMNDGKYDKALQGINRCMPQVEIFNFITDQKPKPLPLDSLEKEWREAFVRVDQDEDKAHALLVSRAVSDTLSILCIRAMTGYIYYAQLLDVKTGKRTEFTLYPADNIYLLVKPRDYFLICSSEVQFTEGLRTKTWRSTQNVIPVKGPDATSLYRISLKTQVHRSK